MTNPSAQFLRIYKDTPVTVSDPNGLTEAAMKNDKNATGQRQAASLSWVTEKERATRRGIWSNTCACTTPKDISVWCAEPKQTFLPSRGCNFWRWPTRRWG